jgi:hypothetical protein
MNLSGTWQFNQLWDKVIPDNFTATFNSDGTVTLNPADGFAMVWYTGSQPGQQGIILAGDNGKGILAAYYGTMGSDNKSMSGTATGQMIVPGKTTPVAVTGTWKATLATSEPADK